MVTNITSLSRSGLSDWLIQRFTAVVLSLYTIAFVLYLAFNPDLNYQQWRDLFSQLPVQIFTLLALLSIVAHAWVGMWTVTTDYLNERALGERAVWIRFPVQLICFLSLFSYMVWGVYIFWGLN